MVKKLYFFGLILIVSVKMASATPDSSKKIEESFLGSNDSYYYTYMIEGINPGSYYSHTESIYICKYNNINNKMVDKIPLRETKYYRNTDIQDWDLTLLNNDSLTEA